MKKSTKGAIAAGAAAVLLLGGAGSLAFWSDETTISDQDVTTGELKLSDAECDEVWVYAEGNAGAGDEVGLIVPGDSITKDCEFAITATGDNLEAELAVTPEELGATSSAEDTDFLANVSASYVIDEVDPAEDTALTVPATITSEHDEKTVVATITVEFPFGDDEDGLSVANGNLTQDIVATLDDITVTLTQQKANPVVAE